MKKKLISPRVVFLENDKTLIQPNNKGQSIKGKSSTGTSSSGGSGGGSGINLDDFILVEDNFYLLQEDGSKLKI
jgi:hypothetical protein